MYVHKHAKPRLALLFAFKSKGTVKQLLLLLFLFPSQ